MTEIDQIRKRVEKIFLALRNATNYSEAKDALDVLKSREVITDGEFRLSIANHDLQNYVNAFH